MAHVGCEPLGRLSAKSRLPTYYWHEPFAGGYNKAFVVSESSFAVRNRLTTKGPFPVVSPRKGNVLSKYHIHERHDLEKLQTL
jgi:hypothetical protein